MASNYVEEYTATDDEYFVGYDPTAIEPGRWLTILTVSYIGAVVLLLGPAVYLGRRWKKYVKAQRKLREEREVTQRKGGNEDDDHTYTSDEEASRADKTNFVESGKQSVLRGLDALNKVNHTVEVEGEHGDKQIVPLPSVSALRVPTFSKTMKRMVGIKASLQMTVAEKARSKGEAKRQWKSAVDATSGNTYWYNRITGEVSWDAPPKKLQHREANRNIMLHSINATSSASVFASNNGSWKPAIDPSSGRPYWYNKRTRETSWAYPPDLLEVDDDAISIVSRLSCRALSCGALDTATLLGLDDTDSDNDSDDTDSDDSDSDSVDSDDESTFEDYDFVELPPRVLEAAMTLGYTKDMWDKSIPPPTEDLDWEELTEEQQAAAIVIGYTEQKWDGDSDSDSDEGERKPKKESSKGTLKLSASYSDGGIYDDYDWNELPPHAKDAARMLGYDRRAWDFATSSPVENKSWKQLTGEQKAAAKVLGYTSTFWNHEPKEISQKEQIIRGWETFYRVLSFDNESKRILRLAIPFTAEAIIDSVLEAIVAAFISKYLGSIVFTAYAMVDVFFSLTGSFSDAMDEAGEALVAQALGMANFFLAGQYTQMTLLLWLIIDVPICIIWILFVDDAILALGLGQDVADIANAYVPIAALSEILDGITSLADGLLRCDGKANAVVIISSFFHILHVMAVGVAVINFDVDLVGVAWIEVIAAAAYGIFMIVLVSCKGWLDPYKKGLFRNFSLKNVSLVKDVLKMSIPLSFGYFLSYGEWEVLTFFAAHMGGAEVAAWCIAGAIWEVMEYSPSGISSAAIIRIGLHLGKGNPTMAKLSSYKSLLYSGLWSGIITTLFVVFSNSIIAFFTSDPVLIDMLKDLIVLIASGNVLMVLGSDAWHIITAQSRGEIATVAYFVCMWCVTMPLSAYFVYAKHYNLQALAASVVIGYASIALVLLYLVFTSNWPKVSMNVISMANQSTLYYKTTKKMEKVEVASKLNTSDEYTIMTEISSDSIEMSDINISSQEVTAQLEQPNDNATRSTRGPHVDLGDGGGIETDYKRLDSTEEKQNTKQGRRAPFFNKFLFASSNAKKEMGGSKIVGEAEAEYIEFNDADGNIEVKMSPALNGALP